MFRYLRILCMTVCMVAMAASGWAWGNNQGAEDGIDPDFSIFFEDVDVNEDKGIDEKEFGDSFGRYDIGHEEFNSWDVDDDAILDEQEFNDFAKAHEDEDWWEWPE